MKKLAYSFAVTFMFVFTLHAQSMSSELKVGDKAPGFTAVDDYGDVWHMENALGREAMVIYFYPAAFTGGCTKQACSYRDDMGSLEDYDVEVIGISGDYPEELKKFRKEYNLNYTLLSDPEGKVAKLFGVPVKKGGEIEREIDGKKVKVKRGATLARQTFVIDKNGKIVYINRSVKPEEDSKKVLEVLKKL